MKNIAFLITNIDFGGGGETITKTLAHKFMKHAHVEIISLCNATTTETEGVVCKTILKNARGSLFNIVQNNKTEIVDFLKNEVIDVLIIQEAKLTYWLDFNIIAHNRQNIAVQHFNAASFLDIYIKPKIYLSVEYNLKKKIIKAMLYPLLLLNSVLKERKKYANNLRLSVDNSNMLVVLTEGAKEKAKKILSRDRYEKIKVIPNAINIPDNVLLNKKHKTVLFVGRVEKEKGANDLLKVWRKISINHPDAILKIAGNFADNEIKSKVSSLNNIEVVGYCNDMKLLYAEADILLFLSYSEGLPMVLLESMSYGVVPIVFDCCNGPKEIIENNRNGYVVFNRNIKTLVEKVDRWFESDNQSKLKIRRYAVESSKKYSVDVIYQQWENIINKD